MESLTQILVEWGYWGLFVSALVAGSLVPFSSEAVLVVLLGMGAEPIGCLVAATAGNTLGGMTCYWVGSLGRPEWMAKIGVGPRRLAQARKFVAGRGAVMGFFGFLPVIGGAIVALLGLMRANPWVTAGSMLTGKVLRYVIVLLSYEGIVSLF